MIMLVVDTHGSEEPVGASIAWLGSNVHPYFRRGCNDEVGCDFGEWS